ncbi:hypothetical protein KVR01_009327 [Diaporthe batatas]|uniref:uncharacterized protein n=1 Tax=Diaporthe batatas TaxID=748121 RepID=UPI001D03DB80|nr:uncharacterized protein KVR01_009327 [Diaporthe batatas]KAG8161063.1 hypothetical protein KVR01_009327 [Diaporthe batatas]
MLCEICWRMLRGQIGRQWRGTYDLHFDHHVSINTLKASHSMGCGICRVLYEELMTGAKKQFGSEHEMHKDQAPNKLDDDQAQIQLTQSIALLGVIHDIEDEDVFRLDFKLEWVFGDHDPNTVKRTFVLKQTGEKIAPFRTPMSGETSSSEVFKLALTWITQCDTNCSPACAKQKPSWYPTRLIDIRTLKSQTYLDARRMQYTGKVLDGRETLEDLDKVTVKLVERPRTDARNGLDVFSEVAGHSNQPNNLYVTLSHCWGQVQPLRLEPNTYAQLKNGIEIEKLPKTFRDAITFASQLHNVGWIWIDSLCIYQSGPGFEKDWLHEAALMQRVYRESYLNISATAASNSDVGLYTERDCRSLWEDEVNLKVDGIPGLALHEEKHIHDRKGAIVRPQGGSAGPSFWKWFVQLFSGPKQTIGKQAEPVAKIDWGGEKPLTLALPEPEGLRRCVIIDISHWDNLVNKAPVNVRAWVLQERLLAPRVLHFCKGSIAWECGGFTRAEGHPTGLPRFGLQHDKILPEVPLKGLNPFTHGKELRRIRLGDAKEPDPHIPEKYLYGFELWARVVEMYSKMNLTLPKDKLIALYGIAQLMSTTIFGSEGKPATYVAGLWRKYLESQLLWRVEPIFIRHNRSFHQPGRRPEKFRAPSFSWASVDAQNGLNDLPSNGITYGEVTDRDLLIEVGTGDSEVFIESETDNSFGLVTGGYIMVRGKLRRIELSRGDPGRFYWRLLDRNGICQNNDCCKSREIDREKHYNVYLDAPTDDQRRGIFDSEKVYCLPAAVGPRSEDNDSKYIVCLVLQQADDDEQVKHLKLSERRATFRRIGLTKLSGWGDKLTYKHILDYHQKDRGLPHWPHSFDLATKRHLIRII